MNFIVSTAEKMGSTMEDGYDFLHDLEVRMIKSKCRRFYVILNINGLSQSTNKVNDY